MIHELKTTTGFFNEVASGRKQFEVRIDDRPYHVGDYLALNEYSAVPKPSCPNKYTGRCMLVRVTYTLRDNQYCKEGFVILGIVPCEIFHGSGYDQERNRVKIGVSVYDRDLPAELMNYFF